MVRFFYLISFCVRIISIATTIDNYSVPIEKHMNIQDLEKFIVIAATENMQQAALELDTSASVLSKSLKRLEALLNTELFDRVGKNIRLNPAGELLRPKAALLVAQAKQTRAEFNALGHTQQYRIAGPSILLFRWASILSHHYNRQQSDAVLRFDTDYEQETLQKVIKGEADIGLITSVVSTKIPPGMFAVELESITMRIAASEFHPAVKNHKARPVELTLSQLLDYPFAAPNISPYCGEARGVGCDGWQNQLYPRKLEMIVNDYSILSQLVKSGQVLAYLPEYCLDEWDLIELQVTDCSYQCVEKLLLVSWQKDLLTPLVSKSNDNAFLEF